MDTSAKGAVVASELVEREKRRLRTLEEKLLIVEEAMHPGASVAAVARRHGVNANLLFGWRRLHRKGLLIEQRHGTSPPLLPVQITSPTITPTRRAAQKPSVPSSPPSATGGYIELSLPSGISVRLHGAVQREALATVLAVLGRR